jgi:hypothetical protein
MYHYKHLPNGSPTEVHEGKEIVEAHHIIRHQIHHFPCV